jgi:two-component system chemotaxis response regulator CheY
MDKKIKILLVDDDQPTREMYVDVFKDSGFEVIEAEDGVEGLDKATAQTPDAIFSGIIMPKMDGFAMMEALKKNVATSNIPIFISSHMGREEDRQKANVLGAKGFFVKGFITPKEVVEKIQIYLSEGANGKIYKLEFVEGSMDSGELAGDLGLENGFRCFDCSEKMVIELTMKDSKENLFEARLVCPQCGKTVR